MADDNAGHQPTGSSIIAELDMKTVKEAAEALKDNIKTQPVDIPNDQSGQLSPSHTPGRSR